MPVLFPGEQNISFPSLFGTIKPNITDSTSCSFGAMFERFVPSSQEKHLGAGEQQRCFSAQGVFTEWREEETWVLGLGSGSPLLYPFPKPTQPIHRK